MNIMPTFHLRRVNPKNPHLTEELILLGEVTKFGRNADNVDVVLTSAVYSNMISRDHAIITGIVDPRTRIISEYRIRDNSLNGTYIDDKRVKDEMVLADSAVIKFGHMNGAAIKAGAPAPQANAEFSFVFEKRNSGKRYPGWDTYLNERVRTVVCTGDGKPISETGDDHRSRRKSIPTKEPVSSTTAPVNSPQMQHNKSIHPPSNVLNTPTLQSDGIIHQMQQQGLMTWQNSVNGARSFSQSPSMPSHQSLIGLRANGQLSTGRPGHASIHESPLLATPSALNTPVIVKGVAPFIRSPPVECDSSVPSPPKNDDTRTGHPHSSSQHSPRRNRDDDEDSFSVPDSPPRAPRPPDQPGRSVTNSPAPPSPRPVEKGDTPKEDNKQVVAAKRPVNGGKAPKSGGAGEKKNKEVDRLLTDLTEGSFAMQARRKSVGGAGSERRKTLAEGKKSSKQAVPKNRLHGQISSASSDEETDDDETSAVPIRSSTMSRLSMVGKKASSSSVNTPKRTPMKGAGSSKKKECEESDPYEDTDEDEGEKKTPSKNNSVRRGKEKQKERKSTRKVDTKTKRGSKKKRKKKGSDESDEVGSESDEEEVIATKKKKKGTDEEYHDTEDTRCDAAKCNYPKDPNVHWVQCDKCEKWFHNFCVFGSNIPYKGKTYLCMCSLPKKNPA